MAGPQNQQAFKRFAAEYDADEPGQKKQKMATGQGMALRPVSTCLFRQANYARIRAVWSTGTAAPTDGLPSSAGICGLDGFRLPSVITRARSASFTDEEQQGESPLCGSGASGSLQLGAPPSARTSFSGEGSLGLGQDEARSPAKVLGGHPKLGAAAATLNLSFDAAMHIAVAVAPGKKQAMAVEEERAEEPRTPGPNQAPDPTFAWTPASLEQAMHGGALHQGPFAAPATLQSACAAAPAPSTSSCSSNGSTCSRGAGVRKQASRSFVTRRHSQGLPPLHPATILLTAASQGTLAEQRRAAAGAPGAGPAAAGATGATSAPCAPSAPRKGLSRVGPAADGLEAESARRAAAVAVPAAAAAARPAARRLDFDNDEFLGRLNLFIHTPRPAAAAIAAAAAAAAAQPGSDPAGATTTSSPLAPGRHLVVGASLVASAAPVTAAAVAAGPMVARMRAAAPVQQQEQQQLGAVQGFGVGITGAQILAALQALGGTAWATAGPQEQVMVLQQQQQGAGMPRL